MGGMPLRRCIIIMTDTQRADMLGCYGSTLATPRLDRLAAQGLRCDRAYTCQPVCGPARSALFTGTYPHSNGVWANSQPLGDTVKTIGQRLSDQGVACGYIGKWHLDGGDYFGMGRAAPGWDAGTWYDMRNYLDELTPGERAWSRDPKANREGVDRAFTFGHRCSNRAIDFLTSHADRDFLLVVSYDEPHHPYLCPEPYASKYADHDWITPAQQDDLVGKPELQRVWAGKGLTADRSGYRCRSGDFFGCNEFVDDEIGRVLDAIDAHAPDALVIYTADHGDFLGDHRLTAKGPAAYDSIARIPFLVRWPGVVTPGSVHAGPVSHIDVVPTVLDAFGVAASPILEGRSMRPTLADPAIPANDGVAIEFGRYEIDHDGFGGFQPMRAWFDGRSKLVLNLMDRDELYDLESDPHELVNRIDDANLASVRDRLHDALLAWMDRTRDPFRGWQWERRPWRKDARPASWANHGMTRQRLEDERYEPRQLDYADGLAVTEPVRRK